MAVTGQYSPSSYYYFITPRESRPTTAGGRYNNIIRAREINNDNDNNNNNGVRKNVIINGYIHLLQLGRARSNDNTTTCRSYV